MGLFEKIFGKADKKENNKAKPQNEPKHAVIVQFNSGIQGLNQLLQLEEKLEKVIADNNAGEYDGHEIAVDYSDGILYMYGQNAENLLKVIKPTLDSCDFMKGATAKLRFGLRKMA